MCQSITLSLATILVGLGLYFTAFAPTCLYHYELNGDSKTDTCPDSLSLAGASFQTQKLCMDTPCFYSGSIGGDKNQASLQAFCHWSYPTVTVFGIMSLVGFFTATLFSIAHWYRGKSLANRMTIMIVTTAAGILGIVAGGLAFADVGANGCSNEKFQTLFKGNQTPAIHYGFATLELVVGLVLVGSAVILSMPKYRRQIGDMKVALVEGV